MNREPRGILPIGTMAFLLLPAAIATPLVAHTEDTDYLQTINAEAQKVSPEQLPGELFHDRTTILHMTETTTAAQVPTDTFENFTQYLARHLHGSYRYFKALPIQARLQVFERARTDPQVPAIRTHIVDLYFHEQRLSSNH